MKPDSSGEVPLTDQKRLEATQPPRRIGRQLSAAFLIVWIIAAGLSVVHLALLGRIDTDLRQMRADEMAIRDSLGLATAIREQYIHIAHCIIHRNLDHMEHYEHWSARVSAVSEKLQKAVPASQRGRVGSIEKSSRILDRSFRQEIAPAIARHDDAAIRASHPRVEEVAMLAAADADLVAGSVEDLMVTSHKDALEAAVLAWLASIAGMVVLAAVATLLVVRLRGAVLQPLAALTAAAQRLGTGDLDTRVGRVGKGELQLLAASFDKMAEQLQLHQKKIVDSERMAAIGELAAAVAHEINNPIGVIRGYLATMSAESGPELRAELRILDEEAAACQRIAEDLLSYAKSGELICARARMDDVVRQAAQRFGESEAAKGRRITVEAKSAECVVDVVRVRQVVQNLLSNAIQASDPESTVEVTGEPLPGGYRIVVSDRGRGIPASVRGRVFEPFFTRRSGGSGLGLAVCKGIVEAHGGAIELVERRSGGTEATVVLYDRPMPEESADE